MLQMLGSAIRDEETHSRWGKGAKTKLFMTISITLFELYFYPINFIHLTSITEHLLNNEKAQGKPC